MPRKESPKTTKEKESLWDEIEALNQKRRMNRLLESGVLDYLDSSKEEDVRIAAHLLNISEEEARDRFYLSPERKAALSEGLKNISKEKLSEGVDRLREESERKRQMEENIREIRERGTALRDMGLGITTTKELLKAVRKYHSIEEALITFRQEVADNGFYGIEREMIPVVRVYGTARDKALLVAMGHYDARSVEKEIVTERERKSIRESVQRSGEEDMTTYRNCFLAYETIQAALWLYRFQEQKVNFHTQRAATEILKYEELKKAQEIQAKIDSLPSNLQQELNSILPDQNPTAEEIQEQWERVVKAVTRANEEKAYYMGGLNGIRNWMREKDATDLMRYRFRHFIDVHLDFEDVSFDIPDKYYKKNHPEISAEEASENGLLLTYEEVTPEDLTYRGFQNFLNEEYARRDV